MLVVRVIMQAKANKHQALIDVMAKDTEMSQKYDGCEQFTLLQDTADPSKFILYEEWDTAEHFNTYQQSDYLEGQRQLIFPLLAGEPDSAYYQSEKIN